MSAVEGDPTFDEDGYIAPPPRKKRKSPEGALQRAVVKHMRASCPPDLAWTAIESAGRGMFEGAELKRRGVRAGVSDIIIALPGVARMSCIELKTGYVKQSDAQAEWQRLVEGAGGLYEIARSVEDVDRTLRKWGVEMMGPLL